MENELILEIGTEEIPALFLSKAEKDLKSEIIEELETNNLTFGKVKTFSTPRRLAVLVSDLKATQIDKVIEHFGPPKRIAFDEKGNPTKAAYGFAKSQNVDIKEIEIVNRSNGEFLCVRNKTKGKKSSQILKEILPQVITSIPFRKSMRWGKGVITFARPIRWIAAVYNGSTIPFKIENIKSSNKSYGHRFISKKPFKFRNWEEYTKALDKYDVILNSSKRRQIIENNTVKLAKSVNGHVLDDPELMETVVNIVEHPTVLKGEFEKKISETP